MWTSFSPECGVCSWDKGKLVVKLGNDGEALAASTCTLPELERNSKSQDEQLFCGPALCASKDGELPLNTTGWYVLVTDGGI
ncbi:hypothetical protein AV530_000067 [Patagioenas fasciata monilis]|uniref:Uncharacterized protein n=1 Tax=Patagioenas fasciata monilis TaxID=372326 RepID=A0A1V4JZX2_PATFA|nr:hypothetical protein AV530_000067 [Patagioenas fasciata monilis]